LNRFEPPIAATPYFFCKLELRIPILEEVPEVEELVELGSPEYRLLLNSVLN
jgi:hypothetical protein